MPRLGVQATRAILLIVFSALFIIPLLWMVSTSLKPLDQTMQMPPRWLPYQWQATIDGQLVDVDVKVSEATIRAGGPVTVDVIEGPAAGEHRTLDAAQLQRKNAPQWNNYGEAIHEMREFPRYLRNSIVVCILSVIGTVISCSFVAYGFARVKWKGRDALFILVLATMMIPFPVTMVPLYGLFRELGFIGSLKPLWVPTFFGTAFSIFLLRQFFQTIPHDLSEAARIDGCSEFTIFWRIILPLAKPAVTVVALFQFLYAWNDFLSPLIYLTDQKDFTLALGLQFFQSQQGGTEWHYLMAASALVLLPVLLLFFFTQRTFIEGVSMSGLKA
jgi:multiple sugar transport system permease protein